MENNIESEIQGRPTLRLGSQGLRLKVSVEEWMHLWRLWDKARNLGSQTDIDNYNAYAKSLVEKYDIHLADGETVEFT
ncbi:MAG: hypothetical protein M1387_06565 [Thaumarchaeota archaeon]|nr:hypothetical protein [Nitrososphaerota archaeon]